MKIAGLQKTSLIDYPGFVSSVIFLAGCNLRCPYCHNAGVVNDEYEPIPYDDVREHFVKRAGTVEAAVISGGEPTLHDGLKSLCGDLRSLGLKIKIDTNGLEPEIINDCKPDYLALDVKAAFENYHRLNIAQNYDDYADRLRQSINIARAMGGCAEIRVTAAPKIICYDDTQKLCAELRGVSKVYIQQFAQAGQLLDPSYTSIKNYTLDELQKWREEFLSAGINAVIRE